MKIKIWMTVMAVSMMALSSCGDRKMTHAEFSGDPIMDNAQILRDKTTKQAQLRLTGNPGKWELYAGPSVDSINFDSPVAQGEGGGDFDLNVPTGSRSYFQLVTPNSKAILAEKHLPMEGGYNFRDLGGIRNADGRYVKWGKLFRSDDLANLTNADLRYLSSIPIMTVIDFRSLQEINDAPDRTPASVNNTDKLMVNPGNLADLVDQTQQPSTQQMMDMMMELNRQLVTNDTIVNQYRIFFSQVQDENRIPLLFHCTAGKDRTGMAAALILSALDVDRGVIFQDYLLSNEYLGGKYASIVREYPNLEPLMQVHQEYLQAGFDAIDQTYGSVDNYLQILGVDKDKMKNMYLY